jgi:hypothetical protein
MANTDTLRKNAVPYLQRLVEDDYVHDQLSEAAMRLNKAYRRGKRKKAAEAAEDKKLYAHVRGASASLRRAVTAVQRKPPPEPKHRARKLAAAGVAAAGAALAWRAMNASDRAQ